MWKDLSEAEKTRLTVVNDELELNGIEEGIARYHRIKEAQVLDKAEGRLITLCIDQVTEWIVNDQKSIKKGHAKRGRPQTWAGAYLTLPAEKLAFIALKELSIINFKQKLTAVAMNISRHIQTEHEAIEIRAMNIKRSKEEKGFARNIHDKLDERKKIKNLYNRMTGKPLKWSNTEMAGLGTRLIQAVVESTGMWTLEKQREKTHWIYTVEAHPDVLDYILETHGDLEALSPRHFAMCCPPLEWGDTDQGIYGGYRISRCPFVRDRINQDISCRKRDNMPDVIRAVNSIQSVEWCVDTNILDLAGWVSEKNHKDWDGAVSSCTFHPVFDPFPNDATKEQRKVWHHNKDVALTTWRSSVSRRFMQFAVIRAAKNMVDLPVFFPHSLDWRGRIYPISTTLHPQGSDLQKALLRFARKKPLGVNGLRALMLAAAGHAGVDKVSFDDRIKWLKDNYDMKEFDPYTDNRWVDYDSPFLFVQTMMEIVAANQSGNPSSFLSNVSVSVDGSQNGLQHLSALGRDPVGGASVNLIDGDKPSDLYAEVAQLVFAAVLAENETAIAAGLTKDEVGEDLPPIAWLETISHPKKRRAAVKRSVLAYPYGVTKPGMSAGLIADGITNGIKGSKHRNAWYLATHIDLAVRDVVIAAARLMDWFRDVAQAIAKTENGIKWVAPSGFPVNMHYLVVERHIVETCLAKLSLRRPQEPQEVDVDAMVRGIVANFIHSLDASHVVGTCNACVDEDITDVHFIHDSYGTHACDIGRMGVILREQFIKIHESDPLQKFVDRLGVETPPLPPKGNLDLKSVLSSKFFFA